MEAWQHHQMAHRRRRRHCGARRAGVLGQLGMPGWVSLVLKY
jgi:hypothetical protein